MAEKYLVVDQLKTEYEGLFDLNGLFNLIDSWLFEKGYDKNEKRNEETVNDDGTRVAYFEMRPWKKTTEYAKNTLKIQVYCKHLKEVEIEREGKKVKVDQGHLLIIINGYLQTDWQFRWHKYPLLFFLNIVMDRYIFGHYTARFKSNTLADVNDIQSKIKGFLNMYKYSGEWMPQWSS
jgi:hypothetical protein